ncbi:MAG: two-component regulator propeller domain-containing protein [Rhodothermales bacterium]
MRIAILLIAVSTLPSGALSARQSPIFHLDSRDGLSQRIVYDVHEDRNGFVWLATRDGLNRYDGHHFKVFRHEPGVPETLSDSKVMSIEETPDGALWIGTMSGGLNRFDPSTETFRSWQHDPDNEASLPSNRVEYVNFTGHGSLLLSTRSGELAEFDLATETIRRVPLNVDGTDATMKLQAFVLADSGILGFCRWTPSASELPRVALSKVDLSTGACEPLGPSLASFGDIVQQDSLLFVVFQFRYVDGLDTDLAEGIHVQTYSASDLSPQRRIVLPHADVGGIFSVWVDDPGTIWISGLEDVLRAEDIFTDSVSTYSLSNPPFSLPSSRSLKVMRDSQGNLWVGTHAGVTLQRSLPLPFNRFSGTNPPSLVLPPTAVNSMLELDDESMVLGTNEGLFKWNRDPGVPATRIAIPQGPSLMTEHPQFIRSLSRLSDGTVLIGTSGWLYRMPKDAAEVVLDQSYIDLVELPPVLPQRPRRFVLDLLEDSRHRVWVAGSNQVVVGSVDGRWHHKVRFGAREVESMSSHNLANTVFESIDGTIWLGNDNGLYRVDESSDGFDAERVDLLVQDNGCSSVIWDIEELDSDPGTLWLATVGGGLLELDVAAGESHCLTTADGLPSNMVYALQKDERGGLWFSTTDGLGYRDAQSGTIRSFTRDQGLHDDEFDLASSYKARDGRMYFGGPSGMTFFDPERVLTPHIQRDLMISEVSVFGIGRPGLVSEGDTLIFQPDERSISIRMSTLSFGSPTAGRFRYRLTNEGDAWIPTDPTSQILSFHNLSPGLHRLEFGYVDEPPGSPSDSFVYLRAYPPFWRSSRFVGGSLLLILMGIGLLFKRSRAAVRRDERQKAKNVSEMARIVALRAEQERGDVARTLHDGPIQTLYALNHQLEANGSDIEQTRETIVGIAEEIRDVCDQLRPKVLDVLGIQFAVDGMLSRIRELVPGLEIVARLSPNLQNVPPSIAEHLYWIAQTALGNVVRHSQATRLTISIGKNGGQWLLRIEDDGVGFLVPKDLVSLAERRHFGLIGIQERTERIQGRMTITSRPGHGTKLTVMIPE